jgi:hypothetical protein
MLGENKPKQTQSRLAPSTAVGLKGYLKKQSQFNRSEFCVLRTANRNLKKQSQFMNGQNERKYLYERIL